MRKSEVPQYDERFRGYWCNKISHVYHLVALGTEFHVIPNAFISAIWHEKSDDCKKSYETKDRMSYIQALYSVFRDEIDAKMNLQRKKVGN